jgi:hypothetical protein
MRALLRTTSPLWWIWLSMIRSSSYGTFRKGNLAIGTSSFMNLLGCRQLISLNFSFHCILSCIYQHCMATVYYIDSYLSKEARNFGDLKELVDMWLFFIRIIKINIVHIIYIILGILCHSYCLDH